ncbi:hypothetical protein P3W45_001772 [Vairimorpha bombi]|jgi:alpha,alpha-trehalase
MIITLLLIGLCTGSLYINDPIYHDMLFTMKIFINTDSKYFVDLELKRSFDSIKDDFLTIISRHNTDPTTLKQSFLSGVLEQHSGMRKDIQKFCSDNFKESTDLLLPVDITATKPSWFGDLDSLQEKMCNRIFDLWKTYYKRVNPDIKTQNTLLPLKGNLCVLGGRFNEMYYWDTYWIIIGLVNCNMVKEAYEILKTFVEIIKANGFVPNATRTYYLNRSHPPMFSHMLDVLYKSTDDTEIHEFILNEGLEAAEDEYNYFMKHKILEYNGVLFNVYKVDTDNPRIESYTEDFITQHLSKNKQKVCSNLATGAESGWDFSSRWFEDGKNLQTINILHLVPVDLNATMLKNLCIIKKFYEKKHEMDAKYVAKIFEYNNLILKRRRILRNLWNSDEESWNDLNIKTGKYNDKRFYFSNIFPLFFDLSTKDDAYRVLNRYHKELFGYIGGAPISGDGVYTDHQWDFPNVWAPCIQLLVEYLSSIDEHKMAIHVSKSFYLSVRNEYLKTGMFFEKYNCREVGKRGDGGEYPVQNGFGWTNGTIIYLLKKYGKELEEEFDHHRSYEEIIRYLEEKTGFNENIQVCN